MPEESRWKYARNLDLHIPRNSVSLQLLAQFLKTSSECPFLLLGNNESCFDRYETDLDTLDVVSEDLLIACTCNVEMKGSGEHLRQCD